MTYNLERIAKSLPGQHIEVGDKTHENFVNVVRNMLSDERKGKVIRYDDFVHDLFLKSPVHISRQDIDELSECSVAYFVIYTGVIEGEEDIDVDTADILYYEPGFFNIIVVKTSNLSKSTQPPNIISAYKLAQTCARMIENEEYDTISIDYISIDWREDKANGKLVCEDAQHVSLFKTTPSELFINCSASFQVQFRSHNVDQTWQGSIDEWARAYLRHFVASAQHHCDAMRKKFIDPFLKFIE